jgi:serine/threonine-protein phosphatase 6 regulatory ankyrin repeat subunit B
MWADCELLSTTAGRDRMPVRVARLQIAMALGANLDFRDNAGLTALHRAAQRAAEPLVRALLSAGARPIPAGALARTPLHSAINLSVSESDTLPIVQLLLGTGMSISARDLEGVTPLQLAARFGMVNLASFLLERGAPADDCDRTGLTPLHEAAMRGQGAMCRLLVARGANLARRNRFGCKASDLTWDTSTRRALGLAVHSHALTSSPS